MRFKLLSALRASWRLFAQAREGQVALTFGFALLPLVLAIGCGVDISRAMAAKSRLQVALDATAIAVARMASTDEAAMTREAQAFFYANFAGEDLGVVGSMNATQLTNGTGVVIIATARVPTAFMSIAGYNEVDVSAQVEVMREARALEVVLVLDTTASMQGTRITGLRNAATDFINTVAVDQSVRLSIVPFAQYVNIGLGNRTIPGVSVPADSRTCQSVVRTVTTCTGSEQYQTTCTRQINPRPGTCTVDGAQIPCTVYDTETYPCTRTRKTGCTTTEEPVETCTTQTWRGCVGSRRPPFHLSDEDFSGNPLPGLMNTSCGRELTPLTNAASVLRSAITALSVAGNTYIPSGLSVGWHVLSPRIPFQQATSYAADRQPRRMMILMTDGNNTLSLNGEGPLHTASVNSRISADAVTLDLCSRIKQDGIELYAIAFEITDPTTNQMLETCSSGQGFFYEAEDSLQLLETFRNIAVKVTNLRVSK
jgi:Flp pilus assembly protein TadG